MTSRENLSLLTIQFFFYFARSPFHIDWWCPLFASLLSNLFLHWIPGILLSTPFSIFFLFPASRFKFLVFLSVKNWKREWAKPWLKCPKKPKIPSLTKSPRPFHKRWVKQLFCGDSGVLSVQGLPMWSVPSNWCRSYCSCRHRDMTCPISVVFYVLTYVGTNFFVPFMSWFWLTSTHTLNSHCQTKLHIIKPSSSF